MRTILLLAAAVLALLPGCQKSGRHDQAQAQSTATDTATDEQTIRASISRWHQLIQSKNAEGIALLFADEGIVMAPGQPSVSGREAVREFWRSTVKLPGMRLTLEPDRIDLSQSGDIAIDRGTYRFQGQVNGKALDESGKYVVIWRKIGKDWKVVTDIWNSNQSPAAA